MIPRSLYIHVPFCVRRCSYCDFAVDATSNAPIDDWIVAITRELRGLTSKHGWPVLELETLYLGGGTPSLIGVGGISRLLESIAPYARVAEHCEFTAEANPESFTSELASDWKSSGVSRISLGAQSFHENVLRWMGRMHGPDGPGRALTAARDAGIDDVSIDLIFGLPARLNRDWEADLDRALSFDPTHVSLYGLTAEPATPLGRWVSEGRESLADEDTYAVEFRTAVARLTAAGFQHYEVSNFCRPDRWSRHNMVYWEGKPYIGLGPGAHSIFPPFRQWNTRSWQEYRAAVMEAGNAVADSEVVDEEARWLERVWLGLRTSRGISRDDLTDNGKQLVETWRRGGWAAVEDGRVRLTTEGLLLLDRLSVELAAA